MNKNAKPNNNQLYFLGSFHGIEFNRPELKEKALRSLKNCGLYKPESVDFKEVLLFDHKSLDIVVQLTEEGVRYYTNECNDHFLNCFRNINKISHPKQSLIDLNNLTLK